MIDGHGRVIDYLRLSVTDRCGLRCRYCMPEAGVAPLSHSEVLRYEEMLCIVRVMAGLGIKKVRLTGGEPLARRGLPSLVRGLKSLPGLETVALTTNGAALSEALPALREAGLDSVNISIDTVDEEIFKTVTRREGVALVLSGIDAATESGLPVKLNCVPTVLNRAGLAELARFAGSRSLPLRFIELMPIGEGRKLRGLTERETFDVLKAELGEPEACAQIDPDEKCRYLSFPGGIRLGFISPLSHPFCAHCGRMRLTSDGRLKPCLQYDGALPLRPLLSAGDEALSSAISAAIYAKPAGHHFGAAPAPGDERRAMSQIGG